ncbi:MAG: mechanosensitive ion channel [Paludibacter sp.]|nr:mechanosensitive ion channel [Bacteroidales bacterium]MCM1068982.1 mechanosensitive ion channel [Prevotella sp.]MCM1353645.1 mechanosensitive ion channel [Bacteroides sp.]MCM1442006.1 mechanosensitive ion channel [Muribaculum sp.]MCM1481538.1 mechanosensitive ion channel [Paludibacter sp.]
MLLQTQIPPVISPDSIRTVTETILEKVQTDPTTFWHDLGQSAIHFGLKVLAALVIYAVGAWLIRQLKQLLKRIFIRRKTEATLASFITSLVSISSTVLLIIVTVGTLGVDTTSLAALLAAGGMAIGMALSGTVQNFAGGIMLLVFKPFKAGDYIVAQGFSGTVTAVSIVNTKIRTTDNREIVIPNGALSNGTIDNYSAQPLRRVEWTVSVAYGVDADECISVIQKILHADGRILDSTTEGVADPMVALSSLNANDISFIARVWVQRTDYWDVYWAINKELYTQLPQHGMGFAYPHMDVTLLKQE